MSTRVAVIGAGAAGLCTIRHLASRRSFFSVTAFEQGERVGGTWVYTERTRMDLHGLPIHSSMYRNLKTNLPKEVMAFPDFPFDKNLPSFVTHSDVLDYLERYASHFSLLQHIKFQTQVVKVEPISCEERGLKTGLGERWEVTTAPVTDKDSCVTEQFDAVIVCNGHYSVPLIPKLPGLETFTGQVMHSHYYRYPEAFKDQTVLCLGAASSGQDISIDLTNSAKMVYLCHNKPPVQSRLPPNLQQKPGIQSISGSTVTLLNDEELSVNCILFCTGYHFTFPFLDDRCHLTVDEDERITPLYKHIIHTEFPSLSFIGICKTICPFPQFYVQVLLVLKILDGSLNLPSKEEMDADTEAEFQMRLAEGLPRRFAHTMGDRQWAYNDEIARMVGCAPIPKAVQNLYNEIHSIRRKNLVGYKENNYQLVDEENFLQVEH